MTQFGAIARYLRLSLWPDSLVLDYGASVTRNVSGIIPAAILVGLLGLCSLMAVRRQRWIAFLGFFFFAGLSPTSSFVPLITQTVAEHRMYIALASIVVVTVVAIWQMCQSVARKWHQTSGSSNVEWIVSSVVLSLIALCFGALTFSRNFEYADKIRLWTSNVQRCPDSIRPYIIIAMEYLDRDPRVALEWFNRALEGYELARRGNRLTAVVDRHLAAIYCGRGTAYSNLRDFDRALADFDRSLELDSTWCNAHFYRGMVLGQIGREDEALVSITKAIDLDPAPQQLFIRGEILSRKKQYAEAISDLTEAIGMDASNASFYRSRGHCLMELGRSQEALVDFSRAIRLRPNFEKAFYERGTAYASVNRHGEAIKDFSRALALSPRFADAYLYRAKSLLILGKRELARSDLKSFETLSGSSDAEFRARLEETPTAAPNRDTPPTRKSRELPSHKEAE